MSNANDPFEAFRRIWGPMGIPTPGMAMPTLDPAEVEKRISDLKSVEGWLSMNLNMVKMAIQGLEIQKSALQVMHGTAGAAKAAADFASGAQAFAVASSGSSGASAANSILWPWTLMQQAVQGSAERGTQGDEATGAKKNAKDK